MINDGDIYSWTWKDTTRSSHCYSHIAVVKNGKLFDTYWSDWSKLLEPEEITAKFVGNPDDMDQIYADQIPYYRSQDIVDMRHRNNSNAKIYLKHGAKRDADAMRSYVNGKMEEAERELSLAIRKVERMNDFLEFIDAGELDNVYL